MQPKPGRCQSPKRVLLQPFGGIIVGEHGFPESAQLTALRIGDALFGTVPAEATTTAGQDIRAAMGAALEGSSWKPKTIALIGLSNGFLQYVTTRAEYDWQAYEGGSDLYGPGSAGLLARRLGELSGSLGGGPNSPSPAAAVAPMIVYPGPPSEIMPIARGPGKHAKYRVSLGCQDHELVGTMYDLGPGDLFPRDSVLLQLSVEEPGGWTSVAVDGDGYLEVHAVGAKPDGYLWRIAWRRPPDGRRFRLDRLENGRVLRSSQSVSCSALPARPA